MEENKKQEQPEVKKKSSAKQEVEQLKAENQKQQALLEEYKDKWMRSVAEFDNYKKRNAKLWQDAFDEGIKSVIVKILPVGDNLDWALTLGLDAKTEEGLKNVRRKFDETLSEMGITEINPVGEVFDPNIAEAVMQVEGAEGESPDVVKMVFQKGYKMKEKIIRYAKVSVVK